MRHAPVNRACGGALNALRRIRSRPKRRPAKENWASAEVCDERDSAPPPDQPGGLRPESKRAGLEGPALFGD